MISQVVAIPTTGSTQDLVASADWNGDIGIWDLANGTDSKRAPFRSLSVRAGPGMAIRSLAASPNGRWLLAGDYVGAIHAWDLATASKRVGERLHETMSHQGMVNAMSFSPGGDAMVSVGADEAMMRWVLDQDAANLEVFLRMVNVRRVYGLGEKLYSVAFVPGSESFVAAGGRRLVRLIDSTRSSALADNIHTASPSSQPLPATMAADASLEAIVAVRR